MSRVIITGGTGHVGRHLRAQLLENGLAVRIGSQRPPRAGEDDAVEWAIIDLAQADGLRAAVEDVDVIVHAASSALKHQTVDVQGTARLLAAARDAQVRHLIYISIIGVDRIDYGYYKSKLAAEELIVESGVPYSILRAAQFHWFADFLFKTLVRPPVALFPMNLKLQTISHEEVAAHLALAVANGPMGRLPDIGGPEIMTSQHMIEQWLDARAMRRPLVKLSVTPGGLRKGWAAGYSTTQNSVGRVTWAEFLAARYGPPEETRAASPHTLETGVST